MSAEEENIYLRTEVSNKSCKVYGSGTFSYANEEVCSWKDLLNGLEKKKKKKRTL